MIGRVSTSGTDGEVIKNYIVAIGLSQDLTFPMQRWVNPKDVITVFAKPPKAFLRWFTGTLPTKDLVAFIRKIEQGATSDYYTKVSK
jgi:hypothetical protein